MKMSPFAAAAVIALSAVPAFAGEGNGSPFALRTPAIASTTVAAARPDTGAEDTPNLDLAFAEAAGGALFASNAAEASVQPPASLPAGALDGISAYAQAPRPAVAARVTTAAR